MIKEKSLYRFFLGAGVVLFLYSLWERVPDLDGAWIGENAYWLATAGYAKSELMRGITSQETLSIIHHKLFNLFGALWIKLFGFSVYTLKSVSLLFFVMLIVLMNQYSKKSSLSFKKTDRMLLFILLLFFPWVFKYAFVYRPEIMITTLGFVAFIFLEESLQKGSRTANAWFAGLLMGLAMAAHLNGIVMAASGFFLLVWSKQYKLLLPFVAGTLMGFAVYFYDYYGSGYFDFWYYQFFDSPTVKDIHKFPIWIEPVINLFSEHLRYFHDIKIIVFTLFMLFTLSAGFGYLYRNYKTLTRFTLLMFVFTGMFTIHDTRKYIILNLPYILLLLVITVKALRKGEITRFKINMDRNKVYRMSFGLMLIYLLVSFGYNLKYSMEKFTPDENREITLKYANGDVSEMNIVAPLTFIFNEIEYYNSIQGEICYTEFQKEEPGLKGIAFLKRAELFGNSMLIITPYYQHLLGIDRFEKGKQYGNFVVKAKNDKMIILVRKK